MRVLIATVQVPFVRGGAELLADELKHALVAHGHRAEIVAIPFKWSPPERILDQMLACRLLDLTESCGDVIDRVIGLKFPAYLIPHPNKVLWILHQHRQAYELWNNTLGDLQHWPLGATVRRAIQEADRRLIPNARSIYSLSRTVSDRLLAHSGIHATPLYSPPPLAKRHHCSTAEDFLFFPSRLTLLKRQQLVLEALALTTQPVRVVFSGAPDTEAYAQELRARAAALGVDGRIEWLGAISNDQLIQLYATCRAVLFPPIEEDYGYVTLEAMLSSKPVITCTDSGGPLEFVTHEETGLVAEPTAEAFAAAMDRLWQDKSLAGRCGRAALASYTEKNISWSSAIDKLLQ